MEHITKIEGGTLKVNRISQSVCSEKDIKSKSEAKWFFLREDIKWDWVIGFAIIHLVAFYGFLTFPYVQRFKTFLWGNSSRLNKYKRKNILSKVIIFVYYI